MLDALGMVEREMGAAGRKPLMVINQVPAFSLVDHRFIDEITGEIEAVAVKAFQATASKAADGGLANTADRSNDVEFGSDSPLTFAVLPHSADLVRTARDWDGFIARSKRRDSRGGLRAKFEHGLLSTRWAMATPLLERPLRSRLLNRLSTGKQPAVS
jgi:hypothetical protein